MPELLLEVGTEELPATFVRKATLDLLNLVGEGLKANGLWQSEGTCLGTPRRLIVSFPEVRERQEDTTKEQRGPSLKAAFDASGNPSPALVGFCRSQGVDPAELRKDDQYVWVTKAIPGRSALEILGEVLPEAIRKLTFEKSMRWGSSRMRFARPIRWILAAYDGQTVPFSIEGVEAGLESRGHRTYAPEPFVEVRLDDLLAGLRERKVEPDAELRRERIVAGAKSVAQGEPMLPEALVDENVYLTEWPTAVMGEFRPEFRELPDAVLITAMAKHERMFPVRDAEGRLTNRFVFIRNSGEDATVRKGAEWVLNARFNDAKFFFDEDKKVSLDGFLEKTAGIVFQEKLGTVRQRADRLAALAAHVAEVTGGSAEEIEHARLAGLYSKADLATGLVSELSSLQGVIGGEYARREGLPDVVCDAIGSQYDPTRTTDSTALRMVIADQLDKLAGYLGLGLVPSGSSDPYGLRRAATILIETAWRWPGALPPYDDMLDRAVAFYDVELNGTGAKAAMYELFTGRYAAMMSDVRYDVLEAAVLDTASPRRVRMRVRAMESVSGDVTFIQTATRPINIVVAARKKGIEFGSSLAEVDESALASAEGSDLLRLMREIEGPLAQAEASEDAVAIVALLRKLADPIDRFFDATMVMVDDPGTRFARLTLMNAATRQLLTAGDFSKLVLEGN